MELQYGIQPSYIIDNTLCKMNPEIHPVEFLDSLHQDEYLLLLTVENPNIIESVRQSAYSHYRRDRIIEFFPWEHHPDVRVPWLRRFAEFVYKRRLRGAVAEAGVFQGNFAKYINEFFPNRKCYLFDSFEGFHDKDIAIDDEILPINGDPGRTQWFKNNSKFKATNVDMVLSKMPYANMVITKEGYIPTTFKDIDDKFCFVNLDMDLYQPTLDAIRFFYPRMVKGGVLMLHDYYITSAPSVIEKAVNAYEKEEGIYLYKLPSELSSSLLIVKQ